MHPVEPPDDKAILREHEIRALVEVDEVVAGTGLRWRASAAVWWWDQIRRRRWKGCGSSSTGRRRPTQSALESACAFMCMRQKVRTRSAHNERATRRTPSTNRPTYRRYIEEVAVDAVGLDWTMDVEDSAEARRLVERLEGRACPTSENGGDARHGRACRCQRLHAASRRTPLLWTITPRPLLRCGGSGVRLFPRTRVWRWVGWPPAARLLRPASPPIFHAIETRA